jgi:hypothetical protein
VSPPQEHDDDNLLEDDPEPLESICYPRGKGFMASVPLFAFVDEGDLFSLKPLGPLPKSWLMKQRERPMIETLRVGTCLYIARGRAPWPALVREAMRRFGHADFLRVLARLDPYPIQYTTERQPRKIGGELATKWLVTWSASRIPWCLRISHDASGPWQSMPTTCAFGSSSHAAL